MLTLSLDEGRYQGSLPDVDFGEGFVLCMRDSSWLGMVPGAWSFNSGCVCRNGLGSGRGPMIVVVGDDLDDVGPANLVAALKKDNPGCKVILVRTSQDRDRCGYGLEAGADALLDDAQCAAFLKGHVPGGSSVRGQEAQMQSARPMPTLPSPLEPAAPTLFPEETPARPIQPRFQVSVRQVAQPKPLANPSAQGIAVSLVSACGGTGKTALSILLALAGIRIGLRSGLMDLDLQFGEVAFLLGDRGDNGTFGSGNLGSQDLPGEMHLEYRQFDGFEETLSLLCSRQGPEKAESLAEAIPSCVIAMKEHLDLIVMDTGAFWTDVQASVMEMSDVIVMLMDQRSSSLRACQRAKSLCADLGIPSSRFVHVLNRCSTRAPLTGMDVAFALGVDQVVEIQDGGTEVEELLSLGKPMELFEANNPFARSAEKLLEMILAKRSEAPRPRTRSRRRGHVAP